MMETEKGKRIEQILATDVTREQLAEALWCAESSQRMWHGCAEENRSFRLKAEAENAKLRAARDEWAENDAKLRELVRDMVDYGEGAGNGMTEFFADRLRELGIEVDG